MKRAINLITLVILPLSVFCQQRIITGNIVDSDGRPLPGVNIVEKGTINGTISDVEGDYAITLSDPEEKILVFSYVGYEPVEEVVGDRNIINVTLTPGTTELDEVVITALGITREKRSLGYARQSVNTDDLSTVRSDQLVNSLSGKAAGVHVINASTPTGSNRVTIRGITSLLGNNNPLYVIDGVPLDNSEGDAHVGNWADPAYDNEQIDYGDPLAQLNADDIENIEILKGAGASALYGSRAANGVILITTKKGKRQFGDKWGVEVNSNTMFTEFSQFPDMQYIYGTGTEMTVANGQSDIDPETGLPDMLQHIYAYGSPLLGFDVKDINGEIGPYAARTNNINDIYKTSVKYTNGFTLNKANDIYSLRFTYTNTTADWMMENQEKVQRNNTSLHSTINLSEKLNFDASILYTHDIVNNRIPQNNAQNNPASTVLYTHPNMGRDNMTPWKDPYTGKGPIYALPWISNPFWLMNENHNQDKTNRIIGNTALKYEILPSLSARVKAMADVRLVQGYQFENMGASYNIDGLYRSWNNNIHNWNFEGMVAYNKSFNDVISVNAYLGANAYIYEYERRQQTNNVLLLPEVASITNNADVTENQEWDGSKRINSIFGSASVGYKRILYLDGSLRNDWSSSLPLKNASFSYPAVSTSFVFSELFTNNDILSFGKLLASWAQVGNDAAPYQVYSTYNYGGKYNGYTWATYGHQKQNENLKNELTTSIEGGLETMFWNNRFSFNLSVYKTSTINQILKADVPSTSGFSSAVFNGGELVNRGIELHAGAKVLNGPLLWNIDLNWSKNRTIVESLIPEGTDNPENAITSLQLTHWLRLGVFAEAGEEFGVIKGYAQMRDPETGVKLVDPNTGMPLESEERVVLGNIQPDWMGSIRSSMVFKGISFNFLIEARVGGEMFSATEARKQQFGTGISSLEGRDEFLFSSRILGENQDERRGVGLYGNDYIQPKDGQGYLVDGYLAERIDTDGDGKSDTWVSTGQPNNFYINPQQYFSAISWQQQDVNIYDASFVKLREISIGYEVPFEWVRKTNFIHSARISVVGRNLIILYQNTPKGIDPEAVTNSTNRGLGIEFGSLLPSRSYGININFTF